MLHDAVNHFGVNGSQTTCESITAWNRGVTGSPKNSMLPSTNTLELTSFLPIVLSVIQWVVFIVGSVTNLLVLIVLVWRRSPKQQVTQLFIASLSLADFGILAVVGWFHALLYTDNDWKFGRPFCKFQYSFHVTMNNSSVWTLAVLSLDR
jgi:tachykinin receptor 2